MKYIELKKFFVEAPLYQAKPVEGVTFERAAGRREPEFPVPKDLERHCPGCKKSTNWKWEGVLGSAESIVDGLRMIDYKCRNCGNQWFSVWTRFWMADGTVFVEKLGQYPRLEITLPPDFEAALGDSKDLYIRGMASRHAGYGIGALGHFRRLIDDTIHDMLGVLEAAMMEMGADSGAIETVRQARAGKVFDEKVKLAAEAIPAHLKPGGINPFSDLYDLHSIGLHGLSDQECCEIVDAMDEAMKYVYTELKSHTAGTAHYKEAAERIHKMVAELRARRTPRSGESAG